MRFSGSKWVFVVVVSTIVMFTMVPSAFCETPGIPPGFEDIEAEIYAAQEAVLAASQVEDTPQLCGSCHTDYMDPHHIWLPNSSIPDSGDPSSPYNPYCPEAVTDGCGWQGCHRDYGDDCQGHGILRITDSCASCHSLSTSCGWELNPPVQCFQIGPCAGGTQTPAELIEELVNIVIGLNLHQGISNALDAKLDTALSALDDMNENNDVAAINSLNAFINSVEAQRGNKITNEDADALIAAAQAIIAELESQ